MTGIDAGFQLVVVLFWSIESNLSAVQCSRYVHDRYGGIEGIHSRACVVEVDRAQHWMSFLLIHVIDFWGLLQC